VSRPCEIWENTDSLALEMNECLREFHLLKQIVEKLSVSDENVECPANFVPVENVRN
jgi:hypothetical protein